MHEHKHAQGNIVSHFLDILILYVVQVYSYQYIGPVVEEEVKSQLISVPHTMIANLCHLDAFILFFYSIFCHTAA